MRQLVILVIVVNHWLIVVVNMLLLLSDIANQNLVIIAIRLGNDLVDDGVGGILDLIVLNDLLDIVQQVDLDLLVNLLVIGLVKRAEHVLLIIGILAQVDECGSISSCTTECATTDNWLIVGGVLASRRLPMPFASST